MCMLCSRMWGNRPHWRVPAWRHNPTSRGLWRWCVSGVIGGLLHLLFFRVSAMSLTRIHFKRETLSEIHHTSNDAYNFFLEKEVMFLTPLLFYCYCWSDPDGISSLGKKYFLDFSIWAPPQKPLILLTLLFTKRLNSSLGASRARFLNLGTPQKPLIF